MGEKSPQHRGTFRTLRKMLSMDTLITPKEEENADETERLNAKGFLERRRMSLNSELSRESGKEQLRAKLMRMKSFTAVEDGGGERDSEVGHGTGLDDMRSLPKNGDIIARRRMGETAANNGRSVRHTPPPSPLRLPTAQQRPKSLPMGSPLVSPDGLVPVPDKGMEELLECAVCLERLNDPRTLPCDHTFCLVCLKVQLTSPLGTSEGNGGNFGGIIRCPVCRKEAKIPLERGLASLPTNVYLQSLLRLLSTRRQSHRSGTTSPEVRTQPLLPPTNLCSKCGAAGQLHLYICGHCRQVLCGQCNPLHLSELREKMTNIRNQIQASSQHLQDAEKGFKERFEQIKSQVKTETEKRLADIREQSDRLLQRINALETKRLEEAKEIIDLLKKTVDSNKVESFDASANEGKVELFMKIQNEANDLLNQATRWNHTLRTALTFDRPTFRILDPEDEEDEEEKEGEDEEEEEGDEVEEEDDKVEDLGMRLPRREGHSDVAGGRGERRGGGVTEGGERASDAGLRRNISRAMPVTHDELSLFYRCRSLSSPRWRLGGSRSSSGFGELSRPAGMGVAPWRGGSEMYITLTDGGRVSIFTKRHNGNGWKYARSLTTPSSRERLMCPFGVAFSEARSEVYITDKWSHCIHVYDSEGNWIRRLCKQGRSPGYLSSPEGIAAANGLLFVADTGNDRIQVLNTLDGGFITFVGTEMAAYRREIDYADPSPGSGVLMQPTGVALNAEETKLIVCDSGHNRIKTFDISGLNSGDYNISNKPTSVFGSLGSQKGQIRSARGVAVDRLGFVTVADSGNSRIQIFRPDGRLVRAFGTKGKEPGKFGYPTAVHIGSSFEMFVSDANNHCVYIF